MQKSVLIEIEGLEAELREKVRGLRGADEDQTREQVLLKKRVALLGESLHLIVERVVEAVEEKVEGALQEGEQQAESIQRRLEERRKKWSEGKGRKAKEKAEEMGELGKIGEEIRRIEGNGPTILKMEEMLHFH